MEVKKMIKPLELYLSEKWYNKRIGVDFSEEYWVDPIKRTENNRQVQRALYDIFGDVGMGSKDPKPAPAASGMYGHRFMSALFNCNIRYNKDQAPNAIHMDVDFEYMSNLKIPDFEKSDVINRALAEAKMLKKHYGFCFGDINTGSPLNVAVSVFGAEFMAACLLKPETAQHVLKVIAETEIKLYHEFMSVIEPEKFPHNNISFSYGNCPAIMFSPDVYKNVILPVDKWFRSQVQTFYLHHCGVFDKYIDLYKELLPDALDIGGGSDYKLIRKAFPDTPASLIVNAPDVEGKALSDIDELVGNIIDAAGPTDYISILWTADLSENTNDDTIRALRTVNERLKY